MTKFREALRKKNMRLSVGMAILSFFYIYLIRKSAAFATVNDFVAGYTTGIYIASGVLFVYSIAKNMKALNSDKELKKQYIKATDERTRLIQYKLGETSLYVFLFILLLATILSGFYNLIVFYTLLSVLGLLILLLVLLKVYFLNKI